MNKFKLSSKKLNEIKGGISILGKINNISISVNIKGTPRVGIDIGGIN